MGLTQKLGTIPLAISTDASNNVGIGAAASGSYKLQVTGTTNLTGALSGTSATFSGNLVVNTGTGATFRAIYDSDNITEIGNFSSASGYRQLNIVASTINLSTGTAGGSSATNRLTISSTGAATFSSSVFSLRNNIGAGTTDDADISLNVSAPSGAGKFIMFGRNSSNVAVFSLSSAGACGFASSVTSNSGDIFATDGTRTNYLGVSTGSNIGIIGMTSNHNLTFITNNTERMRITSGGQISQTSPIADWSYVMTNNNSSSPNGLIIQYTAANKNNTGNPFLYCTDNFGASLRMEVRSNGGIANYATNNVVLSDERLKKDITLLESVWDKIKNIEIVKYKFKDQTHDDFNMGVIAQQVEEFAPELVDQDGWGTLAEDGTKYKGIYESDINYYSIKVLQEAMAKIETLETEVTELKALIAAK